jgi:hypothetical protein
MNVVSYADYPGDLISKQIVKPGDIRETEEWTEDADGSEVTSIVVERWGDMTTITMSPDKSTLVSRG